MRKPPTQRQIAAHLGISQPAVAGHFKTGLFNVTDSLSDCRLKYCAHMRAEAAQHRSADGIDRVKEAALLDRRKREELEIKLAQLRKELWPIDAIARVFAVHNANAKNRWLALPNVFKSRCPMASARDIATLVEIVRSNLVEAAHEQLPSDIRRMVDEYFATLHAAADPDGQPVGGSVPVPQPRKQRPARPVAHRKRPVPAKTDGRHQ